MLYLFSLIFALFLQNSVPEVAVQAEFYLEQISQNKQVSENAWALNELAFSSCENYSKVHSQASVYSLRVVYDELECSDLSNENLFQLKPDYLYKASQHLDQPKLLVSYLLQIRAAGKPLPKTKEAFITNYLNGEYLKLARAIIQNKVLDTELLPYQASPILHHDILINRNLRESMISTEYLNQANMEWQSVLVSQLSGQKGTFESVLLLNTIYSSFLFNRLEVIYDFSDVFISDAIFPLNITRLRTYNAVDFTLYNYGFYDRSLNLQRKYSIPLAKELKLNDQLVRIRLRHGGYLMYLGKYEEAKIIFESLNRDPEILSGTQQVTLYNNLGVIYRKLGKNNKFLTLQLKALNQISDEYDDKLLNIYRNLFIHYSSISDINTAMGYIRKARKVALQVDQKSKESNFEEITNESALIDFYLGSFYFKTQKDYEKALFYLNKAQDELNSQDQYDFFKDLLIDKGSIYFKMDSVYAALENYRLAKELTLSKSDTPNYIDALVHELSVHLEMKNFEEVEKGLKEITLYPLDNLEFILLTKYYTVKAQYLFEKGLSRNALIELEPVIEQVINRARNNTDSQSGYWNIQDEYIDAFSLHIEILREEGMYSKAVTILDELKTINDASLYNSPLIKAARLSEQQLTEEKNLNDEIQNLRKKYLNAGQNERFDLKSRIDKLSAEREEILLQANLSKDRNLSPTWTIQRSLGRNELLLHFTEIEDNLYITHLQRDNIDIQKITLREEDKALLNKTANELASGKTNLINLYQIYNLLDLHDLDKQIKNISIIPDNYLYRIPLEILPTNEPDSDVSYGAAHYFIEDYNISYFTSLMEYEETRRLHGPKTPKDFSAFAISDFGDLQSIDLPTLPYATIEAHDINQILNSFHYKSIYTGELATKEAFIKELSKSRMVHVATHSEVSDQDPLFSTIYLSSESMTTDTLESNEALYAYELFDTPFNSEFVMLNSCSSGSGAYMQGTGIMGITRALRYAGAKSLALNLWSVNDKIAANFASNFYKYINEGESKSEAMRKAKLMQLKTGNANPHFWGAYMLIGNHEPLTDKQSRPMALYSILIFATILMGYTTRKISNPSVAA